MSNVIYSYNNKLAFGRVLEFKDVDGVTLSARTMDDALIAIYNHRTATGKDLPPGWKNEAINFICHQHPDLPGVFEVEKLPPVRSIDFTDVVGFLKVLRDWNALNRRIVPQGVSNARAEICAKCPLNVEIKVCWGCGALLKTLKGFLADKSTKYDADLKGCAACGCVLTKKVHLPIEALSSSAGNLNKYAEGCWLVKEIEELNN